MAAASALPDLHLVARSAVWRRTFGLHRQPLATVAAYSSMPHTVRDRIKLNDKESELFATLLAATKHANTGTVLRAAGGWVRDKLLGKESIDIDVALDNMLGKDFADKVNEYLSSTGQETHKSAVIQSNPDQSKHLETARMKITDIWIDLVNLRSETYTQDSRIPTMAFGTAMEDATRRDFTINSMFYNINEGTVEDLTGKGMDDLRAGIIRTPLPPSETFLDDPLRVLRAVRFGTRFGFSLEASLLDAAASDPVVEALGSKVSRERVGTELEGMFNGPAPVEAARLLHRLRLFPVVFTLPPTLHAAFGERYGAACVDTMAATHALLTARDMQLEKEERRLLLLAGLLVPLRGATYQGPKGKALAATYHIIREALKWRAKDVDHVAALHTEAAALLGLQRRLQGASAGGSLEAAPEDLRVALGRSIRQLKQHWRLGALLAAVTDLPAARPLGAEPLDLPSESSSPEPEDLSAWAQSRVDVCAQLEAAAAAWKLENCWEWKPLLDGKQVIKMMGLKKAGPQVAGQLAAVMDWQLANPEGTAEQASDWLQKRLTEEQQKEGEAGKA